jgi:hypothetical protein
MWPGPAANGRLTYHVDWTALSFGQKIGAFFIQCWVSLLVAFLGAFAISLYFSTNTIIYYLMRYEVDATELEEVYVEHPEDEMDPMSPAAPISGTPEGGGSGSSSASGAAVLSETIVMTTPPPDAPPA